MKKTIFTIIFATILVCNLASAFVFRDFEAQRQAELDRYEYYRSDYADFYGLERYEDHLYEPNLVRNFGFYPASHYSVPRNIWNARYNPPLQGEVYSTYNRPFATSLDQPSAVKYYGENVNGRYSGMILPALNGVYFDHPSAKRVYGHITYGEMQDISRTRNSLGISPYPGAVGYGYNGQGYGYGYENYGNARFYARVADQVSDDAYVVGFY